MYKEGYVLSVFKNEDSIREIDGRVYLPFENEYKVRLRNRNTYDCVCDLYIDGKRVSNLGEFVISANSYVDVERFVDHSYTEGKKLQFVPVTDSRVEDPGSSDNGWIEARFYKVKEATTNNVRIGTIRVATNGTDISLNDMSTETGDLGISFSAVVNGANINIRYTSDTNAATMCCDMKRIKA